MSHEQTIPPQTSEKSEPSSPFELTPPDWKESLKRALREFKEDRGSLVSAGMAFYWFLAIFPALLALVGFIGLVRASPQFVDDISKTIRSALPGDAAKVLTDSIAMGNTQSRGGSLVAALIGTAVALWSASAGMVAVQTGLDVVYDVPEGRKYLAARARALVLMLVALVLGGIATAAIVFGQPIGEALRNDLPFGGAFVLIWTVIRWVVGLAALSTLFASFYYFAPNRESPRWAWISPGGVVATLIWLAASLGFSFYVSSIGSYGETYGSITGVVVLILWLFLSALAIVVGGEINAELERQGEQRRRVRPGRRQRADAAESPPTQQVPAARVRPQAQPEDGQPGAAAAPQRARSSYEDEWIESMRRIREESGR